MNILSSSNTHNCTSCQICGAVCPTQAINIELDINGFYRPVIDEKRCVDCSLCVKTCYKFDANIEITKSDEIKSTKLFAVTAKNNDILRNTTSGGIADILARQLISQGYKVAGVVYNNKTNHAVHQIANSIDDTIGFRGSKYIQSYSIDALKKVVATAKKQKYAFFGLPCHIYALNKYLVQHNLRNQCILIDLYCHGCPSMHIWEKTVEFIKRRLNVKELDEVNFRSKIYGWGKFAIEAKSHGKVYHSTPLHNEFYNLFFSNQVLNDSCTDCQLRSTLSYTDIRLGDFWGDKYKNTHRGVSGVSIVTKTGHTLFENIKKEITFTEEDYSFFLPFQSWNHKYKINIHKRELLFSMLNNSETKIEEISKIITSTRSISDKAKVAIKHILFCYIYKFIR